MRTQAHAETESFCLMVDSKPTSTEDSPSPFGEGAGGEVRLPMPTDTDLRTRLFQLDRRGYPAYRDLEGEWRFAPARLAPEFVLALDHAQGDPYAAPSRLRVRVAMAAAGFPPDTWQTPIRRLALEDYLARRFAAALTPPRTRGAGGAGSGHSGELRIDAGGQEVLERTACRVTPEWVEIRFSAGLPAAGRSILARECWAMLGERVPRVVAALVYRALDPAALTRHLDSLEDQRALCEQLAERGLVAFVADGSILPRASGVSQRPLTGSDPQAGTPVPFQSPPELRVTLETPHAGPVPGMGLPTGVTLIVGGGYHGKTTLLQALDRGVYDHVPGDGRERVVTRADAVKIRAEDRRSVERVDISPFIRNLPFGVDTRQFSTANASGSTSQAANIVEALEIGTGLLLIDEDTSATNFMIRDARMQRLVPAEREPITPFIDRVRALAARGVSTILVVGGSGDYFDVADTVIALHEYRPALVTAAAKRIAAELPSQRPPATQSLPPLRARAILGESVDPIRRGRVKIVARGTRALEFGTETIDLVAIEQLVDASQTRAIGDALVYTLHRGYFDGATPLAEALARLEADLDRAGLEAISPHRRPQHPGDYARPRRQELAAALNRLRGLRLRPVGE